MDQTFSIERRTGLIILAGISLILAALTVVLFILAESSTVLPPVIAISIALLCLVFLVLSLYRLYTIFNIQYRLKREGLYLKWGLRREEIPTNRIEWVRPASDLGFHLPMPWLRLPGLIFGKRSVEGLGQVEFLATDANRLILVATNQVIFAISPANTSQFMSAFKRASELGSLEPLQAESITPVSLVSSIWTDKTARHLLMGSFLLVLVLPVLITLLMPQNGTITWIDNETAPATRLYFLAIINAVLWFVDFVVGMVFYLRMQVNRTIIYLLWISSNMTSLLLIAAALYMILR